MFRLGDFADAGGGWSIGTDSQISLNPLEDLRWLDYGQRLVTHRRNTFDDGAQRLTRVTWQAGNQALGIAKQTDYFAPGQPLDAVVYDASSPLLSVAPLSQLLSAIVYTGDASATLGTLVDGRWVVQRGQHFDIARIRKSYGTAIRSVTS
jgi:formimidoylglutamate deiminase